MAQIRAGLFGGGIWIADGSELLLISAVTEAVADEWHLGPMQRGGIVTIVFIGVAFGNIACGPLGDWLGRRRLVVGSYFGIFVFSIFSALSTGVLTLALGRFFVGASFGIGQPAWSALGSEVTPSYWRTAMTGGTFCLFSAGEVYTAALLTLDDPHLEHLHWRMLLVLGSLPSLFLFFLSALFLHESPSFLAINGRREEATQVLRSMRDDNRSPDVRIDFAELRQSQSAAAGSADGLPEEPSHKFHMLFGEELRTTTLIMMLSCFAVNFLYYGSLYAFPQVLKTVDIGTSPATGLLLGAIAEIPGFLLGTALGVWMPRKSMIKLYLCFSIACVLSFLMGQRLAHGSFLGGACGFVGYFGIKAFVSVGWIGVFVYASEVYPTEVRSSGLALCLAVGRFAASMSPLVFEQAQSVLGADGHRAFFALMAMIAMLNLLVIDWLPFETFQKELRDYVSEEKTSTSSLASTPGGTSKPRAYGAAGAMKSPA